MNIIGLIDVQLDVYLTNVIFFLFQVLNRLQVQGKGGGVKLLGSGTGAVAGGRPAFVLQQEKEPS